MTISTNNYQIGQSAVPNQNFHLTTPAIPDGSLQLYRGNVGAPSGAALISIDPTGQITYPSDGAWTTVAGAVTASSGTITSAVGSVSYKKIGRTAFIRGQVSITTNGTGAGFVQLALPAILTVVGEADGSGREASGVGSTLLAFASGLTVFIQLAAGGYPGADGRVLRFTLVVETAS